MPWELNDGSITSGACRWGRYPLRTDSWSISPGRGSRRASDPSVLELMGADSFPQERFPAVEGFVLPAPGVNCWEVTETPNACLHCVVRDGTVLAFYSNSGTGTNYLVRSGAEALTPLSCWPLDAIGEAGQSFQTEVPMRDGVKLCTEVFLPRRKQAKEAFPVIFSRTPYGKGRIRETERLWVHHGYAVVLQDVRGREDSQGEFIGMLYEKRDGDDTLNWIAAQDWCNGRIGTIGGSYGGYVQWAMAASGNRHLKAMVSMVTAGSPFCDIERLSGGYNMGIMDWNLMMSGKRPLFDLPPIQWGEQYTPRPLRDVPMAYGGRQVPFWDVYLQHPHYDEFWQEMTFTPAQPEVPALVITGWHDGDLKGSTEVWEMGSRAGHRDRKLIIGPWVHHFNGGRKLGAYDFGTGSGITNIDRLYLDWFDQHLKGAAPAEERPTAQVFIEGANRWLSLDAFPPSAPEPWYLTARGGLEPSVPAEEGSRSYVYDPTHPAPQLKDPESGKNFAPIDYSAVEQREDVLVFTSRPVTESTVLVGRPSAVVYASTSARDTDFVVRLTRLTAEGQSIRFAEGYVRGRYRETVERETLLQPGKVYRFDLTMPYCGVELAPGDALRVEITSAQYGELFPNSNTGADPVEDTGWVTARQTIWFGPEHPSCVYIPIYQGGERT